MQSPRSAGVPAERGSAEPMAGRCGAKLRGTDPPRYCAKPPLHDRTRCQLHGGKSLRGIEHPSTINGAHSRFVPARYQASVERAMADPDYLSNRHEVGLLDGRTDELLAAIDAGATLEQAKLVSATLAALEDELPGGLASHPAFEAHRDAVRGALKAAKAEATSWREIRNNQRVRARLAEVERRTQERLGVMMPAEQVMALVARLAAIVHEVVPDPRLRQELSDRLFAVGAKGDVVEAEVVRDSRVLTDGRREGE